MNKIALTLLSLLILASCQTNKIDILLKDGLFIENAKAFKLDKLYGTIESGKKTNILLLDKNPLEDISAYNSISKIIKSGKVIDRNTLSAKVIEE